MPRVDNLLTRSTCVPFFASNATGNKSELATGYRTLYVRHERRSFRDRGPAQGAGLRRGEIHRCARAPRHCAIIDNEPSAELRPNQTDQDSLPPYPVLDAIREKLHVENRSARGIAGARSDSALVKVSPKAFGTVRSIPMARRVPQSR